MNHSEKRIRKGKTAKDKKSGAWASRFANRAQRDAWCQGDKNTPNHHPNNGVR